MSARDGAAQPRLRLVPAPAESDQERLDRVRAGDTAALDAMLTSLLPQVHRWTYGVVGGYADVQDLTQEALIELAVALPTFRGESSVNTFARRVVVRTVWRAFKKRKKREHRPLLEVAEPVNAVDPEHRAMGSQGLARLYRCVDRLPEKRRVVFMLCAVEGMTPTEAGEALGVHSTVVRSRLKHARRELTRMLQHDPYLSALMTSSTAGGDHDDT